MWKFYYEVTQVADAAAFQTIESYTSDSVAFFFVGVLTTLIVMSPTYFERKRKN